MRVVIFIADTKSRDFRSLEVVKRLIADSGACNVHDQRFMLPRQKLADLDNATDCKGLWDVMQQGFYVETPCHSIARPGKIMAGTRITLLQVWSNLMVKSHHRTPDI